MYSTVQCVIQVLREALLLKHSVMFATCTSMSAVNVLKCVGVDERILRKRVTIKVRIKLSTIFNYVFDLEKFFL